MLDIEIGAKLREQIANEHMDVFGMTDVRNDTFLETPKTIFPTKKHY